jgi:RimJ/RimL family protein N-acetyltransferase
MPRPVPVLAGQVVTLRPLDPPRDAADYYEWNLDPEMHLWTGNHILASVEEARAELERFAAMNDLTMWAVVDNANARMMGRFFICLERREGRVIAGEGNRIARPFWRKGHNRDARRRVFRYVFEALRADCIETECWTDNTNSRLAILAHGFTLVEEHAEHNAKHGRPMTKCFLALSREDWRRHAARQARAT